LDSGIAKEKSSVPETAPAADGTALNQLLGMKGAALETVCNFSFSMSCSMFECSILIY
jgi:hypothetical protein